MCADNIYAIILAAGKGKRMGTHTNKQFLCINERPLLYYTVKAFSDNSLISKIIIVCSEDEIEYCEKEIVSKYGFEKVLSIVKGGVERQHSVYNGLLAAEGADIVLIHDGARPFASNTIIEDGIKYAKLYGASTCGVTPKDTIKIRDSEGFSLDTPDRNTLFSVQTPQCFKYNIIMESHSKIQMENINVTDDTMVVERYGHKVWLYQGSYENIKITTPEDLIIAERILAT